MNLAARLTLITIVLASCATTDAPRAPSYLATIESSPIAVTFQAPTDVWEVVEITHMKWDSQRRVRIDDVGVLLRHRRSGADLFISAEKAGADGFQPTADRAWKLLRAYHGGGSEDLYIRQSTPKHSTRTFSLVEFEENLECWIGTDAKCEVGHGFSFIERETSHHQRGLFWKVTDGDWWRYAAGQRHDFKGRVIVLGFDRWLIARKQQAKTLVIVEFRSPLDQAKVAERDMLDLVRTIRFQASQE